LRFHVRGGIDGCLSGHAAAFRKRWAFGRFYTEEVKPPTYGYLLSLPERSVRSLSALSGGLLREIGEVALPARIRRTTLYRTMVDVALRLMIEEVGEVRGVYPSEGKLAEAFLLQRGASHGIELLGILAFHASPVWVLAALADAAGGSRTLMREITAALQEEGLLERDAGFDSMEQVLDGLEQTSGQLAVSLNLPPMNVAGLREDWEKLKVAVREIPPRKLPAVDTIERLWGRVEESARQQERSVFAVSSLLAFSAVAHLPENVVWLSRAARSAARRTGRVFGEVILDHYTETLNEMSQNGFLAYWRKEFRPYLSAAATQFTPEHPSLTERLLRRRTSP
jgi:hypothetical protein